MKISNLENEGLTVVPIFKGEDATVYIGEKYRIDKTHFFNEANFYFSLPTRDVVICQLSCKKSQKHLYKNAFSKLMRPFLKKEVNLNLDLFPIRPEATDLLLILLGILNSDYQAGKYKSKLSPLLPDITISLLNIDQLFDQSLVKYAIELSSAQKRAMDLVNAPHNKLNSTVWREWVNESAKMNGFDLTLFNKKQIQSKGFNGLLAVNRGSEYEPLFIKAEYRSPKAKKHLILVGKGVTFDTGGLSIKSSSNMHYMKSDMGGAAAVLGALEVCCKMQWTINVTILVPVTDNAIDAKATKPGDIIEIFGGKTVEIIDTDAEGRLILADAIAYASKELNPDYIVDIATLTGSTVRTFGAECAALFCNDPDLTNRINEAAESSREKLWPMPLWEEYQNMLQSDIADIRNLGNAPVAGAITAAKFLEFFVEEGHAWSHLDIPAMAYANTPFGKEKGATGFGVFLLAELCKKLSHRQMND